jgi:hypothetical protein
MNYNARSIGAFIIALMIGNGFLHGMETEGRRSTKRIRPLTTKRDKTKIRKLIQEEQPSLKRENSAGKLFAWQYVNDPISQERLATLINLIDSYKSAGKSYVVTYSPYNNQTPSARLCYLFIGADEKDEKEVHLSNVIDDPLSAYISTLDTALRIEDSHIHYKANPLLYKATLSLLEQQASCINPSLLSMPYLQPYIQTAKALHNRLQKLPDKKLHLSTYEHIQNIMSLSNH